MKPGECSGSICEDIKTRLCLFFPPVDRMNSEDKALHGPPATIPFTGNPPNHLNIWTVDPPDGNLSDRRGTVCNPWLGETTPESVVLFPPSGEQFRSPSRGGPSERGNQHRQSPQSEREPLPPAVPSEEVRGKTGFDSPQQDWKIPFIGQDPVTGKVYFIDTSPNASNWNATVFCKRHLWYQCPFNTFHLIKTSKKFVAHIQSCLNKSALGYNGKQSQKEVKNWHVCEFNPNHRVHKDYMVTHYLQNCAEMRKELTSAYYQTKGTTAV